jgi:hypothetical protein
VLVRAPCPAALTSGPFRQNEPDPFSGRVPSASPRLATSSRSLSPRRLRPPGGLLVPGRAFVPICLPTMLLHFEASIGLRFLDFFTFFLICHGAREQAGGNSTRPDRCRPSRRPITAPRPAPKAIRAPGPSILAGPRPGRPAPLPRGSFPAKLCRLLPPPSLGNAPRAAQRGPQPRPAYPGGLGFFIGRLPVSSGPPTTK